MPESKRKRIITLGLAIIILFGTMPLIGYASEVEAYEKPVLKYAYVEDETLVLKIERGSYWFDIEYKIDKETRIHEIEYDEYDNRKDEGRVYEIDVEIPSTISITIDDGESKITQNFSIKEDYFALTKDVPQKVLERLAEGRQSDVDRIPGYSNIFELEYGKVADSFDLFNKIISKTYRTYSKADIKFNYGGLSSDKDGNIKLDKFGVFKVVITHNKDKTFEETAYILIKPDWKKTRETRAISNISPYIVYNDRVRLADYLRYEDEASTNTKKTKVDTTYLLGYNVNTDQLFGVNDQINLDLNKPYCLRLLNFEDNSQQNIYVMRQEKLQSKNKDFKDIYEGHWAREAINSLVSKGLLSGYPDGSFNPSGNITVKEFMTILSRQIAMSPDKAKPVVGDVGLYIDPSSWGYIESKSILDRLSTAALYRFNYMNLDRPINRGEVAFLVDNAIELGIGYNPNLNTSFTDINASVYSPEIKRLVDIGLISGYPDGTFKPTNGITRAEVAAIFNRIN